MNLKYLEDEAERFAKQKDELDEIEQELEDIIGRLRDLPKKAARESRFAQFVGKESVSEKEVEELRDRKDELADRREELTETLEEAREELMRGFTSEELVVPLSMEPDRHDREWVFPYRGKRTFPHTIDFLSDTIGLGNPIRVEGVLISEKAVRVPIEEFEMDESEAMEAVIGAFDQLQNTLRLKLPDEPA